jgi:hypothetical protein
LKADLFKVINTSLAAFVVKFIGLLLESLLMFLIFISVICLAIALLLLVATSFSNSADFFGETPATLEAQN